MDKTTTKTPDPRLEATKDSGKVKVGAGMKQTHFTQTEPAKK
jgi:hypothetical protein